MKRSTLARMRALLAITLLELGAAGAEPAPEESACQEAYFRAEERERDGRLREAERAYGSCSLLTCGSIAEQCRTRYQRMGADIPSVVPVVTDAAGAPIVDVEVQLDGELWTPRLDGRALPLDPGLHEFTFSKDGRVFYTEKLLIVQGERNRVLSVQSLPDGTGVRRLEPGAQAAAPALEAQPALALEAQPAVEPGPSVWPYVVGGAGVLGVGASLLLANWARKDEDRLDACTPFCPRSSVEHVRDLYTSSYVSLGIGVGALGVATWLYLTDPARANGSATASPQRSPASAYRWGVQPVARGALASFGGPL